MKKTTEGQMDIFSTFGLYDEVTEANKKKEEEAAKRRAEIQSKINNQQKSANGSTTKTPKEKPFEVNEFTNVYYYGQTFPITDHFQADEIAEGVIKKTKDGEVREKLNEEIVRKRLEKTYFNMVKDYTEIVYMKDKNMLVVLNKAKKKGVSNPAQPFDALSFLKTNDKRIPFSTLSQFLHVAKVFVENELEVHADIYFDPMTKKFQLDFPQQTIHRYWVEVTEDSSSLAIRMAWSIKVAEIHSHHVMPAQPSGQDDQSERVPGMIYVIVGSLDEYFPSMTARMFDYDSSSHIKITLGEIFEEIHTEVDFPSFDMDKITVNFN